MDITTDCMNQPVMTIARRDVSTLHQGSTIQQALDYIRAHGLGERIIYFYVINDNEKLVGVIPTRRLLMAPLQQRISEVMITKIITLSQDATILESLELLARYKFLALPIVDDLGRIVGVVDVSMFADEYLIEDEREWMAEVFAAIGLRISQVRDASPLQAFLYRFPWLLATITSGLICALLVSCFEITLAKSLVLAFFLTLVLGLGESVSVQSMTVAIQVLHSKRPTLQWFTRALWREIGSAWLLGFPCGLLAGGLVWFWFESFMAAAAVGGSILIALNLACALGLSIPSLLHTWNLDFKIAAGPVTLALTDICTILVYFSLASVLL